MKNTAFVPRFCFLILCCTSLALFSSRKSDSAAGTEGILHTPAGIEVDTSGNVWVADTRNSTLRRFSIDALRRLFVVIQPSAIALDQGTTNHLPVIEYQSTAFRFFLQSRTFVASFPLRPSNGGTSSICGVASASLVSTRVENLDPGDITIHQSELYMTALGSRATGWFP